MNIHHRIDFQKEIRYLCYIHNISALQQDVIQSAKDLHKFAEENLKEPAPTRYQSENASLKRRVFFYVERTDQDRPHRHFQEIRGNRTLHSVRSTMERSNLKVRYLSCYCEHCVLENYDACTNQHYVSNWEERAIEREASHGRQQPTRAVVAEQ